MIHYQLQCSAAHGFDGWFPNSAAFDKQASHGLLECPVCGDTKVEKALMAPGVPRKSNAVAAVPPTTPPTNVAAQTMPAHVRAMLQKLRAEVEQNCDYVGDRFADEARRIHNGESDKRGIYGEATAEDAESLAEDGIEIAQIPWVPRSDA